MAAPSAPIPANPFARLWAELSPEILDAVDTVGKSGWYILGSQVATFEASLGKQLGVGHVVGCANGTDAIELALRASGLQPGQKVLTTPLSAFATTLAILRAGGQPLFVDVDESGLLDLEQAEEALRAEPSIAAFVPVHLYGHCLDLNRLEALTARYGVTLIEDCAQAVGARSAGRTAGTVGSYASFSFYPTKNLGAFGDGGATAAQDAEGAHKLQALRNYGQTERYRHDLFGVNSRLDEVHAAILHRVLLPRLNEWTARRRAIAQRYLSGLNHPQVRPLPVPTASESVWHLFPVRVPAQRRAAFLDWMRKWHVEVGVHYPILIPEQKAVQLQAPAVPVAKAIADTEVSLPIHPYLGDEEIQRVIELANAWPEQ